MNSRGPRMGKQVSEMQFRTASAAYQESCAGKTDPWLPRGNFMKPAPRAGRSYPPVPTSALNRGSSRTLWNHQVWSRASEVLNWGLVAI